MDRGFVPYVLTKEDLSHTKIARGRILDKRFRNIDAEVGFRRTVRRKNKEQWQIIRIYTIKCEDKWDMMVGERE
jgi:hypothetical protein